MKTLLVMYMDTVEDRNYDYICVDSKADKESGNEQSSYPHSRYLKKCNQGVDIP